MRGIVSTAVFAVAAVALCGTAPAAVAACANPNAIGVARTVEIDTTGGPGFGFEHYKAIDFLQPKEVVLTFDDGPQKFSTEMVLAALAEQCTKATFFSIGKMALGYPEIIREVAKAGHTIGTHTWSHKNIRSLKTFDEGKDEIERGVSGVKRAVGAPIAPFFRFPTLQDTPESIAYLGKRNIAMFSTDIDSFDFKPQPAEGIVKTVIAKLEKNGKGIVLMHDIHKTTAKAVPLLLVALKEKGYKIVHLKAKGDVQTLAEFDSAIEKDAKGLPVAGTERPISSVVRTIDGDALVDEAAKAKPADEPKAATAEPAKAEPAKPAAAAPATAAVTPAPAAAPTPVAETAPPVTTVGKPAEPAVAAGANSAPATTSSILVPSSSSADGASKRVTDGDGVPAGSGSTAAPQRSLSEKAKDIWELWFGK